MAKRFLSANEVYDLIMNEDAENLDLYDVNTEEMSSNVAVDTSIGEPVAEVTVPEIIDIQDIINEIRQSENPESDSSNRSSGSDSEFNPTDGDTEDSETESDVNNTVENINDNEKNVEPLPIPTRNILRNDEDLLRPDAPKPMKPRKRRQNPAGWKRNIRKFKRNKGHEYTTGKGKQTPAAVIGEPCSCRNKCFEALGEEVNNVFHSFWQIADKNLQDSHLFSCMQRQQIKRKRPRNGRRSVENRPRQNTFHYVVKKSSGETVKLCKIAFMAVFGIKKSRFERIQKAAGNQAVAPTDKRGQHGNHPKISEDIRQKVRVHISSFPRRSSHYSRNKNENRRYLNGDLNLRRMWLMYLSENEPEELKKIRQKEKASPIVKYWLYKDMFDHEFNLSFGQPRSDTCTHCDKLANELQAAREKGNNDLVREILQQQEFHHRKAEKGYQTLKTFVAKSKNDECDMLTFDFQQNLPVPTLHNSDMFYARQLWTYNIGIHNCRDDSAQMHIWSERDGKRGSSEVCTALDHYLRTHSTVSRHLVLFSDSCGGQNKNKIVFAYLLRLIKEGKFKRIDHLFLTKGHTFLPNDRDFGVIEKYKRGKIAYIPDDYINIIKSARTSNPFEVVQLEKNNMLDFKKYSRSVMKSTTFTDGQGGEKVLMRKVMWFSYGETEEFDPVVGEMVIKQHHEEIWGKYTYNEMETWMKFSVLKRKATLATTVENKYLNPVKIKYEKYKDIVEKIVNKGILPQRYVSYYTNLEHLAGPAVAVTVIADDDQVDSDGDDYDY